MKKSLITLFAILYYSVCMAQPDFYSGALGYAIVSADNLTCEVTVGKYSGEVVVPAEVNYSDQTYKVIGVGKDAFHLSNIRSLELSEGIQYVRESAVSVCVSLKKLVLPASLNEVGKGCFGFNSLETLIINDGTEPLHCKLGMYSVKPLEGNDNLTTMTIGRNVDKEFFTSACHKVRTLTIGDLVTSFEPDAFPELRTLTVGSSLQYLPYLNTGDYVSSVTVKTTEPQSAGGFNKHTYMYATLKVPKGTKSAYENAEPWKNFWDIEEYDATGIINIQNNSKYEVYDLHGKLLYKNAPKVDNLPKGVYIINNQKVIKK